MHSYTHVNKPKSAKVTVIVIVLGTLVQFSMGCACSLLRACLPGGWIPAAKCCGLATDDRSAGTTSNHYQACVEDTLIPQLYITTK